MATPVEAPRLGDTVEEVQVTRWAKRKSALNININGLVTFCAVKALLIECGALGARFLQVLKEKVENVECPSQSS